MNEEKVAVQSITTRLKKKNNNQKFIQFMNRGNNENKAGPELKKKQSERQKFHE